MEMNFVRLLLFLMIALNCLSCGSSKKAKVGAYYYPWYREPHEWDMTFGKKYKKKYSRDYWRRIFRDRLVPKQEPKTGWSASKKSEVIAEHLDQSIRGNIDFWAVSWWGTNSYTDYIFKDYILPHPRAKEIKFALLIESTRLLGSFREPDYSGMINDFNYLYRNYFTNDYYLKINGRPVIFIYLTREFFRGHGQNELIKLRKKFSDIYIIGDDVFGTHYRSQYAMLFDAVTAYDVYGQSVALDGATIKAIDNLANIYKEAKRAANRVGTGFIPTVTPGFNDTVIRDGHPPRARYFTDIPGSKEGDIFRQMIRKAGVPYLDPLADNILMVTSFNEWYEDTQIEATKGTSEATSKDDSASGTNYTSNDIYTDYGYLYLDILSRETK